AVRDLRVGPADAPWFEVKRASWRIRGFDLSERRIDVGQLRLTGVHVHLDSRGEERAAATPSATAAALRLSIKGVQFRDSALEWVWSDACAGPCRIRARGAGAVSRLEWPMSGEALGTLSAEIAVDFEGALPGRVDSEPLPLEGRMQARHALGYVTCQLAGALIGAVPLLLWGAMGESVIFGATVPGASYGTTWVLLGEAVTTFALVFGLFYFLRDRALRVYTPALFPPLYAIMVWLEAPISGTSTNPARSFGPALISGDWQGWWIYWLGPLIGTLLGVAVYLGAGWERHMIEVAKLYHFGHDPHGIFHRQPARA
ncbi:MAG: aquaporin, partial [Pseudolabrys sp.]